MNTIRQCTIYPHKITLTAQDQYNDYSVIYNHYITVEYGNGRTARFDVGTNANTAISKYDDAVELLMKHAQTAHLKMLPAHAREGA